MISRLLSANLRQSVTSPCISATASLSFLRHLTSSTSQFGEEAASAEQVVSASTSQDKSIYVACVLERLPIVAPPLESWELEFENLHKSKELRKGNLLEYHDVRGILKPGDQSMGAIGSQGPLSALSREAPLLPRAVPPSMEQNTRSMKRHLDKRLYLMVKQSIQGSQSPWQFPHMCLEGTASVRKTCQKALRKAIGMQHPVYFIGNAPMAWMPLIPGGRMFFMLAQVVDDPWESLSLHPDCKATDYAWVTKEEAASSAFCGDVRMGELLSRMLSD